MVWLLIPDSPFCHTVMIEYNNKRYMPYGPGIVTCGKIDMMRIQYVQVFATETVIQSCYSYVLI